MTVTKSAPDTSSTDIHLVPIKTWLHPTAYRRLAAYANDRGTTVAVILAQLADKVTTPRPLRGPRLRVTPDMLNRIVAMHQAGASQPRIAFDLGISQAAVNRKLAVLGLRRKDKS